MQKHFVTFLSPGTFVSETTTKEIDNWDVDLAINMAKGIKQRHAAVPYGFYFETKESDGWQPKTITESGIYYLGGKLMTLDDIPETPENMILRSNMKNNEYEYVIENTNSWKVTMPFRKGKDVLIEFSA